MTDIKNKAISTLRRKKTAHLRTVDIEDPFHIGNKKAWPWWCKVCGSRLVPYKQDEFGDIVVACENPNCVKSGNFAGSINVELKKLLKKQQNWSSLYYRTYNGGYY